MKIIRCSICWLCLIILCLYAFPMGSQARATSHYMGNVTWEVEDGRATITGTGTMADNTCPWGVNKEEITEVIIGPGVEGIGKGVFKGYSALTKVTIHEGLRSIDQSAFEGCNNIKSISLPASLKSIGYNAFKDCTRLKSVYIADLASWCSVNFQSNPLSNGADLYIGDQLVTDLVIPEGCEEISPYAFAGCGSLETVYFPDGLKEISKYAFFGCGYLKRISLPGSVTLIGHDAFNQCSQLRTATYRGRPGQLKDLHIDASANDTFWNVRFQLGTGYMILFATVIQLLVVGIPVGILFLILFIRRRRRGY